MRTKTLLLIIAALLNAICIFSQNLKASIKKHNREVVFSSKPIEPGDESALISEGKVGEPIYLRFYMDSTAQEFYNKWKYSKQPEKFKYLQVNFYINNTFKNYVNIKLPDFSATGAATLNTFGTDLVLPKGTDRSTLSDLNKKFKLIYGDIVRNSEKEQVLKLEFFMSDGSSYYQKYATGSLKFVPDMRSGLEKAGVTNSFHLAHKKQIVFSDKNIEYIPDEKALVNEYAFGDPLFYRLYMDKSLEDLAKSHKVATNPKIKFKYFIDGKEIESEYDRNLDKNKLSETSLSGQFFTNKKEEMDKLEYSFLDMMHSIMNSLKGTHKLKVEAWFGDTYNKTIELMGSGEISIKEKAISNTHPAFTSGEPEAAFKDPVLEKKFIAAFNANWKDKNITALKAYPCHKEWAVFQNELTGAPVRKGMNAILLVKDAKGCRYVCAAFSKDHEGGGKYGEVYYFGYCYDTLPAGGRYVMCK